jgi:hypothetical protein
MGKMPSRMTEVEQLTSHLVGRAIESITLREVMVLDEGLLRPVIVIDQLKAGGWTVPVVVTEFLKPEPKKVDIGVSL